MPDDGPVTRATFMAEDRTASVAAVTHWPSTLNADIFFLRDRLSDGVGERVALRLDERTVTYQEVDARASGFAALLLDRGVKPEDRVLIILPDDVGFVSALFGVFRIGAVVVMLNPGLTTQAMSAIIDGSRAAAAIVHGQYTNH